MLSIIGLVLGGFIGSRMGTDRTRNAAIGAAIGLGATILLPRLALTPSAYQHPMADTALREVSVEPSEMGPGKVVVVGL